MFCLIGRCSDFFYYIVVNLDICESVLFWCFFYVAENVTGAGTISYYNMSCNGGWYIRAAFIIIELCPWVDVYEVKYLSSDIFQCNIFIYLWRVGTHFQPEQVVT